MIRLDGPGKANGHPDTLDGVDGVVEASSAATLFDGMLGRWAEQDPTRPAIEARGQVLSYGEVARLVRCVAGLLRAHGVGRSDRVLLQFSNSVEHVVSLIATTALGALAVAVPAAGPDRLRYIADLTQPRLCLYGDGVAVADGVPRYLLRVDLADPETFGLANLGVLEPLPRVEATDSALILFSSGSTGRPKAVVLRHKQLLATSRNLSAACDLRPGHRDLVIAPMPHSGGWQRVAATLYAGGCLVIPDPGIPPQALLELLPAREIHGAFFPSTMLRLLLRVGEAALRESLRTVRSIELGSTTVAPSELRLLRDLVPGGGVFLYYGLTECSRATILSVRAHPAKCETVGRPTPGVEIQISDPGGHAVPVGDRGEIWLRGPQQTDSYFGRPDLDQERFCGGWLRTGDHGQVDADGFLRFLGRTDDMITCASYHFFPAEVETELGRVPGVSEYIVVGVSDPTGLLGEMPHAFVLPENAEAWAPGSFLGYARSRLPAHMTPRAAIPVREFPLTPTGKIDRKATVELYGRHRRSG